MANSRQHCGKGYPDAQPQNVSDEQLIKKYFGQINSIEKKLIAYARNKDNLSSSDLATLSAEAWRELMPDIWSVDFGTATNFEPDRVELIVPDNTQFQSLRVACETVSLHHVVVTARELRALSARKKRRLSDRNINNSILSILD